MNHMKQNPQQYKSEAIFKTSWGEEVSYFYTTENWTK